MYVDSQENLKGGGGDDMSVVTSDSRRGSLYFDETDGKYGTWKRRKLERCEDLSLSVLTQTNHCINVSG